MPGADVSRQALAGSNSELALECKMSVLCKFVKITPNFSFARDEQAVETTDVCVEAKKRSFGEDGA